MSDELEGPYESNNDIRILREWELRHYLGKILTFIDAIGLPEKQEKAFKDLVKQHTWSELWNGGWGNLIRSKDGQEEIMQSLIKEEARMTASSAESVKKVIKK